MNRDEKSNKTNEVKRDTGLVSVTEASYLDAQILAGVDEDGTDVSTTDDAASTAADATASASTATADASGGNKTEDSSSEANRKDDEVVDQTRKWTNGHYGIKDVNDTDPIYGHKVFKDEMSRFLPYHTEKPVN